MIIWKSLKGARLDFDVDADAIAEAETTGHSFSKHNRWARIRLG